MDLIALAQQATNILLPALPFIYAGKDVVTDKVKDMLLEKGIGKLGAKSIDRAKVLLDKIRSKESESIEKAFNELSQNPEDLKAKNELQQEILKLLIANPGLAKEIELTINFDVENINQFAVGDHNTLINFDNSSKQKFENCRFEGNVFGNNSPYTDNSQDILRQLQREQRINDNKRIEIAKALVKKNLLKFYYDWKTCNLSDNSKSSTSKLQVESSNFIDIAASVTEILPEKLIDDLISCATEMNDMSNRIWMIRDYREKYKEIAMSVYNMYNEFDKYFDD